MIEVDWADFSEVGPRTSNQDRTLKPKGAVGEFCVVAVADGIGGAPGGEEAATIAVDVASRAQANISQLPSIFDEVVLELARKAETAPDLARMGTTLSVAVLTNECAQIAHVGDTRIYHLRGAGLVTLTEDQTEAAVLVKKGVLRPGQVKRYPRRNVLLSALTVAGEFELFRSSAPLQAGDRFLLLTDGVYQKVPRGSIVKASLTNRDIRAFVAEIKRLATIANPSDNYSALGIEVVGVD